LTLSALAGPAGAAEWTLTQLSEQPTLFGISCPSPSFCAITGNSDAIATSTDPTGGPGAWSFVYPGPWPGPAGNGAYNGNQIRGVSCPSPDACFAGSLDGDIYSSTNPTGPASAWPYVDVSPKGPNTHVYGISCPSPSLCVAVASEGKIVTSTEPTGNAGAWTTTQLAQPLFLSGVSCPSVSLCVAVGRDGSIAASTDPTGGAGAWQVATAEFGTLFAISCPAPALCVTGNSNDIYTSTEPTGGAAAWSVASGVTPLQIMAVSCPSTAACAAANNNADVFTTLSPTGGPHAWSFVNSIPYTSANGVFGLSCPTQSFCAEAAANGQVAISTDPFGDESATPAKPGRGKHHRRPTVKLVRHPHRRLLIRSRKVRVRFGFREIGVRLGFVCGLDRSKYARCRSPKSYSVGPGRHTFRVKAFDPGGFDQTVTRFHFRVLRVHSHGVSRAAG
jgi:hypothetical protein